MNAALVAIIIVQACIIGWLTISRWNWKELTSRYEIIASSQAKVIMNYGIELAKYRSLAKKEDTNGTDFKTEIDGTDWAKSKDRGN